MDCAIKMAKEEGITALWAGWNPGIQRQMVFASLRIGLYFPVRTFIAGEGVEPSLWQKILTGLLTGAFGICVANPTDVLKIRLQADGLRPPGTPPRYRGIIHAYTNIVQTEGVKGLWTGIGPNIARNAIINASELASYDQFKTFFLSRNLMNDNIGCHLTCGFLAGFVAVIVGSPVDVMKTRIMNAKKGSGQEYSGVIDCFYRTMKNEGPLAFYSGFWPNFLRLASWNTVMFMALEQVRSRVYGSFYGGGN